MVRSGESRSAAFGDGLDGVALHDLCRVVLHRIHHAVQAKDLRVSLSITDGFTELPIPEEPLAGALAALAALCVSRAPKGGALSVEAAPDRAQGALRIEIATAYAMGFDRGAARALEPVRRGLDRIGAELIVEGRPDGAVAIHIVAPLCVPGRSHVVCALDRGPAPVQHAV